MSWRGRKVAFTEILKCSCLQMAFNCSAWYTFPVQRSPFPFQFSSSLPPVFPSFPPHPSFALYAPLPSLPPLSLSSHSCTSFSLPLSPSLCSPEGMSKCMVEWRREVGLALPNSISEKLELREACLPSQSTALACFYSFISSSGAPRHAEINTNPPNQ